MGDMGGCMVVLTNTRKMYGKNRIFDGVDMTIDATKPTVIMGKNGCGKTTLLKIIAGILVHSSGEAERTPDMKVAFVPDRFPKLPFKTEEYLLHMGDIQGLSRKFTKRQIDANFELFGIPDQIKTQKIAKCSKGTIQKINLIQAFLTRQDLLVMDEPFSGLDESSTEALIGLLTRVAGFGTAIALSCHDRDLAQKITDNVLELGAEGVQHVSFD